ncbi:MAG: Spermidine/putrescine transport system permease protein PotB [Firmicutes bacterium ADurb.Bin248]|nr:MAG: Spermidine/putrescine transport system permease protein PotB [Firmicutes bacterium ADurb.Bin248]HOG00387.1 ABC transporter permease [Clostridia bacterium]HPK15219.1 ABC transporter permease [Clostridia bacterium]
MQKRTWKTNLFIVLMLLPALVLSLGIIAYPMLNTLVKSFRDAEGAFTLENYRFLFTDKIALDNIWFTFWVTAATVLLAIAFAYVLSLYLRFSEGKISRLIGSLYLLPRFVPTLVAIYAMMTVVRDSGFLNRVSQLFGASFKPGLLFNPKGIIMMNLWFNIPFAAMIVSASLSAIPNSVVESARDVGAHKLSVFFRMILPLSIKDVLIAMTFVFMSNISSFTTPYLIGPNHPMMLGVYLRRQFSTYMNYELSAALSVVIFLFSSVSAVVYLYTNLKQKEWEKVN